MMTNKLLIPAVLLVALGLTAPASAGQARPRENHGDRTKATEQTRPQRTPPPASARGDQPRQVQPREAAPPRSNDRRQAAPQYVAPRQGDALRYAPQREPGRAYAVPRDRYDRYDRYDRRDYGPTYRPSYRGYVPYRPHYFARSYFTFRPRVNIGFGLWLGYPVPYPYAYVGSYYTPRVYGAIGVMRPVSVYGGLSFEISPYDAAVFVDGEYAGTVGDFPPNAPPLTLTPGPHRIEIQAEGYRSMMWDVTIVPGQVIPWQGAMQPW
jgi:hypothetical protein